MVLTHFETLPAPVGRTKYDGVAAASDLLVFAPYSADHIALLDPATRVVSNVSLPFGGHRKWVGAAAAGGRVYFAPHTADTVGVFDVSSRAFSFVRTHNGAQYKYAGAAHSPSTGKIYFGPHNEGNVGVLDPSRGAHGYSTLRIPASITAGHEGGTRAFFHGALASASGEHIVFPPYNADHALVLDTTREGSPEAFTSVALTGHAAFGDARFMGGAIVEDAMGAGSGPFAYLAPYNARDIGVLDVRGGTFASIDIPFSGLGKYNGAAALGGKVYFSPCTRTAAARRRGAAPPPGLARSSRRPRPPPSHARMRAGRRAPRARSLPEQRADPRRRHLHLHLREHGARRRVGHAQVRRLRRARRGHLLRAARQ